MSESFNLVAEPWIPCLEADGAPAVLSLRDALLRAHELREVAGDSPLVTAAIYRLLLAVLHQVYGPEDEEAWLALWRAGHWDAAALDTYLSRWRDRFDLFDPELPFLQRADARVKPKSVASLLPEVASGNNPTLFDHHVADRELALSPAHAARALLGALSFGLAGLSGLPQKFTDAPCARGVIFFAEGDNLFETLCLNLTRYPWLEPAPGDRPAWEADDASLPLRDHPLGLLDLLTWPNRSILLQPERAGDGVVVRQMTVAPNLPLHADVLDPYKCYRVDKKRGYLVLRFNEGHALWRDVSLLLGTTESSYPAQAVAWLRELVGLRYLPRERRLRFIALGMANDQAKVNFTRAERLPVPLAYLAEPALVDVVGECLELAEGVSRQLWGAANTLASLVVAPESDHEGARKPRREDTEPLTAQWAVDRHYWSQLELPFRELLEALPGDPEGCRQSWRETLRRAAAEALDTACRPLETDVRRIKAVVRARDQLALGVSKALRTVGG